MGSRSLRGVRPGRLGVFLGELAGRPVAIEREVVAEIETFGYGTLWYGEGVERECFAHGAILLASTSRLVIASGIANVWARDPQAMASGGRTLAEAWPGRFILGIGIGHAPEVAIRGHMYKRPVSTMRSYLDAMSTSSWTGPEVPMPPVLLAALGPRMVALAAEKAVGDYMYFTTAEHVREVRAAMSQDAFIAADLPVVLAKDRSAARAIGDRHTARYLTTANYRNNLLRLGWSARDLDPPGSDRLFDATMGWGELRRIREKVDSLFAAGADQVVLNPVTGNGPEGYRDSLRELAVLIE